MSTDDFGVIRGPRLSNRRPAELLLLHEQRDGPKPRVVLAWRMRQCVGLLAGQVSANLVVQRLLLISLDRKSVV